MTVALTILAAWTANCGAFEAWGFISGAGHAAVENQAHLEGDEVHALGGVTAINRFDKASGTWRVLLLQFCDDRLFKIGEPRNINPPSAAIFLDTLYGYIEDRGSPTVLVAHNLLPNGNSIEEIEYRWGGPPDTISLIFTTPAHPMENVVPGIREEHKDTNQCTKPSDDPR
jgi:hypothetical protein